MESQGLDNKMLDKHEAQNNLQRAIHEYAEALELVDDTLILDQWVLTSNWQSLEVDEAKCFYLRLNSPRMSSHNIIGLLSLAEAHILSDMDESYE